MNPIIAVVFDFDDTLAPDSTSGFLNHIGINVPLFWRREVQTLLDEGWDPIPAYLYKMIALSDSGTPITRDMFVQWGRQIAPYDGTTRFFGRLEKYIKTIHEGIMIEYYIISSGIGEIIRNTKIVRYFTDIWACDFIYRDSGQIEFPKNIVSFTDKTRYLFHIAKGIVGPESRFRPFDVNKKVKPEQLRIPFEHMIYVGDGYTDIPCFSLVRKNGGIAIGVFDRDNKDKWRRAWGFIEEDRVSNLVPTGLGANSALSISLFMAAESIAKRIVLRSQTYQG